MPLFQNLPKEPLLFKYFSNGWVVSYNSKILTKIKKRSWEIKTLFVGSEMNTLKIRSQISKVQNDALPKKKQGMKKTTKAEEDRGA